MKKILLFALVSCMVFTSVYAKRVSVYCLFDTESKSLYEDDNVKVMIIMDSGKAKFAVYNKTQQVLFVDKANSFAYTNGQPQTLFTNAAYTTGKSTGKGASVNLGSVANAMGIGGAAGSLLGGVNVGGGSSVMNTTTVFEQRVMAVAPQSVSVLYEWVPTENFNEQLMVAGRYAGHWELKAGELGKFVNQLSGEKEKFRSGMVKHYETSFQSPLAMKGVVSYSTSDKFENPTLVNVESYISDVYVDTYKSYKKKEKSEINVQQYLTRPYFAFRSGGISGGALYGEILVTILGTSAIVAGGVLIAVM
ncbi:MAG: hypothetical protein IJ155_11945 [Prevotella sp.]|nr:hypothetical protein [Prevotella sp.]